METEALAAVQEMDFSMMALFWRAGLVVKAVMVLLVLASFWSWAIFIQKAINFRKAKRDANSFDSQFWSGQPLDELYERIGGSPQGAAERIFCAAMEEWTHSHNQEGELIAGVQARIDRSMDVAISRESQKLSQGLSFLATVGSTAPFVGLFGTVWGIVNVFREIGVQQNTNLAVVAPGIGEALVATALGLLAAIPAVIFYNKLSSDANMLTSGYESFSEEFATIISRQLDG